MTKITKMNFLGTFFTATALLASATMVGCAPPLSSTQNPPIGSIQGATQYTQPTNGNIGQIPSQHQGSVFGTYRGTILVLDDEARSVSQNHTITVAPNGTGVLLTFSSGNQHMQAPAVIQSMSSMYGGTKYLLTSQAQNNPSIYPHAPVILQLQISVDGAGNFDAYNSSAGMYEGYQFRSVVKFNSALSR